MVRTMVKMNQLFGRRAFSVLSTTFLSVVGVTVLMGAHCGDRGGFDPDQRIALTVDRCAAA